MKRAAWSRRPSLRSRDVGGPARRALAALAGLVVGGLLPAQEDDPPETEARPDIYTQGEESALEALGYVAIGHNTWADRHDTRRIEEGLGKIAFCWIETAHFKLGSSLPAQALPRDKDDRKKLREELSRLAKKLPNLRPRSLRQLDPWLRAHLFAMRLEEVYAEILELTGVTDEAFPGPDAPFFRGEAPAELKWMGRGPFLGLKGKSLVLLCAKSSSCGRYLTTFTAAAGDMPSRWYFEGADCFLFATAAGFAEGAFRDDRAMHAHVAFNVAHNLLDAYKGYSYLVPVWWKEGIAHRLRRVVSEEHNNYSAILDRGKRAYTTFDWDVKVKQRARHDLIRPWTEILDPIDCSGFDLVDHMACWSRVCWLLEEHPPEQMALFLDRIKGFVDAQGNPAPLELLLKRQREAIEEAFGADAVELERQWLRWVDKTYRVK